VAYLNISITTPYILSPQLVTSSLLYCDMLGKIKKIVNDLLGKEEEPDAPESVSEDVVEDVEDVEDAAEKEDDE